MSLLKCVECGGMVSSKAAACPHCGCPVEFINGNICIINGRQYDLTQILELSKRGHVGPPRGEAMQIMAQEMGLADDDQWELWETICQTGKAPAEFNSGEKRQDILARMRPHSTAATETVPKCPTCGSTKITKLGVASRAISGAIYGSLSVEGRAQFRCNNCGYQF